jgi:HlyD family secretion protein
MIEQSEAQVHFANDDFDRARKLAGGVMSVSTIEQRETAMKTAQAQQAAANNALAVAEADRKLRDGERRELQVKLAQTEVKAPVGGLISRRTARLGAAAGGAGEPLFRIIKDGAIDLDAEAPEQALPRLAVGMSAQLALPGVADKVSGTVRLIATEVDKASRTGRVRIALDPGARAHVGGFASAEITLTRSQGVGVPASAVARDATGARALVVRDGVVEQRKVTIGVAEGDAVEIAGGVNAGEMVVARAAAFLRPGDRVSAVTTVAEGATP